LFTGDLSDTMGSAGSGVIERNRIGNVMLTEYPQIAYADLKPKRWAELVANPLTDGGLAVWATLGPGDLTRPEYAHCGYLAATYVDTSPCQSSTEATKTGDNAAWRRGLASQASPWGTGGDLAAGDHGLGFAEVLSSRRDAQPLPDVKADPNPAGEQIVRPVSVPGGARTHYAVDVLRGGRVIARVVTVDSSLRSLATGDPVQQPIERSGQQAWLERMICETGKQTATGQACTKPAGVPSIVLSNTPTYSYGPGALDGTATDQVALESVLLRHEVSAVVSGRLGWNARYWATAPGLHEPCVGGAYQDTPPVSQVPDCGATGQATQPALTATSKISTVLQGLGAPNPPPNRQPHHRPHRRTAVRRRFGGGREVRPPWRTTAGLGRRRLLARLLDRACPRRRRPAWRLGRAAPDPRLDLSPSRHPRPAPRPKTHLARQRPRTHRCAHAPLSRSDDPL
jgi:hypothetical protein